MSALPGGGDAASGPDELTTEECTQVLERLAAAPSPPHVVFTGGDPLKRPDLATLVRHATTRGMDASVAPSASTGLTREVVHELKRAGVTAMSLSVDGPTPAHHDGVRGVLGCFGWTLAAAQRIVNAGIPLQINTLVTADSAAWLEDVATLVARIGAARWSLFFLVGVGRGRALRSVDSLEAERTLRWAAHNARRWPFVLTTTEAPHYRRIVVQSLRAEGRTAAEINAHAIARTFALRDGNGIMFIAANGDVTPSGFLPLVAGNVRSADPIGIYSASCVFRDLRMPERLRGRCACCAFREICGGSRARAWAGGDLFGEDPLCAWVPTSAVARGDASNGQRQRGTTGAQRYSGARR